MEQKSWTTALLLSIFLGTLGIDRLYLGQKWWWLKLITCGGCYIWWIYDIIQIVTDKTVDGNGQPLLH